VARPASLRVARSGESKGVGNVKTKSNLINLLLGEYGPCGTFHSGFYDFSPGEGDGIALL